MAAPTYPMMREAAAPATGDGFCVLSVAMKDDNDDFLQEILS